MDICVYLHACLIFININIYIYIYIYIYILQIIWRTQDYGLETQEHKIMALKPASKYQIIW